MCTQLTLHFATGIRKGRGGLGAIFVWATGNGGHYNDYCNCDGYITSIFTVSIGAVNDRGKSPWYAEPCPSTLAVTYSSGETRGTDKQIVQLICIISAQKATQAHQLLHLLLQVCFVFVFFFYVYLCTLLLVVHSCVQDVT